MRYSQGGGVNTSMSRITYCTHVVCNRVSCSLVFLSCMCMGIFRGTPENIVFHLGMLHFLSSQNKRYTTEAPMSPPENLISRRESDLKLLLAVEVGNH